MTSSEINFEPLYFGTGQNYLDIFSLRYRWFGAVWKVRAETTILLRYAFADNEEVAKAKIQSGESAKRDDAHLEEIYKFIRNTQKDEDWGKRSRLHLFGVRESPWKKMKPGWYIVRSRKQYPLYISAVHVKRFSTWLNHTAVCENQKDVSDFIQKVNRTHHIKLLEVFPKNDENDSID
ncbi:hypothetical protein [Sporolactobacillus putidus]|uniref:Uncharacterized protein n=1 Tax=Sporolactobacillus putidus TaxID=492735 RepID=A0A917S2Z2_9BACL|nr:hypothetical protein [Sporolactobacillus putidus]GGL54872.1 hypothetical protein GCM10007968_18670 [Sporolactobacillus putidus]